MVALFIIDRDLSLQNLYNVCQSDFPAKMIISSSCLLQRKEDPSMDLGIFFSCIAGIVWFLLRSQGNQSLQCNHCLAETSRKKMKVFGASSILGAIYLGHGAYMVVFDWLPLILTW